MNDRFVGHDKEKQQIFDLLLRTISYGESNSALLIGPKGSGKTTVSLDVDSPKLFVQMCTFSCSKRC